MKHFRKSVRGMARDDAEARSWRALCAELKSEFYTRLEESFVLLKSSFFFALWQHFFFY